VTAKIFTFIGLSNDPNDPKSKIIVVFANGQKSLRFEFNELGKDSEMILSYLIIKPITMLNVDDEVGRNQKIEDFINDQYKEKGFIPLAAM
jgi:hypothetical protein